MDDQQDAITAYHGSPHDFEQFDTSKIGTGEGAQAYGHGLYFAEHEPVAVGYRDALSPSFRDFKRQASTWDYVDDESAIKQLQNAIKQDAFHGRSRDVADSKRIINYIKAGRPSNFVTGHMYEVHINAHPGHFLDWEKPLGEQSPHVQAALAKSGIDLHQAADDMFGGKAEELPGSELYHWLTGDHEGSLGWPEDVTKHLSGLGIKGIRYLDEGSRKVGEGTRNYVVFDHNDVHIKRKYEQGGAVEGFADGGDVMDDSRVRRSGEGGTETALDFIQNTPLYKQRLEAQGLTPPATAPSTKGETVPVTAGPPPTPPAIVQTAPAQPAPVVPVQQAQPPADGKVGLYHIGTNDIDPTMTVQSAQRIIDASRAMGINPVFLLPNQTARGKFNNPYYKGDDYLRVANNSYALQKYLDENGIQYVMPEYNNKVDPYHMTAEWTRNFAKTYNTPFIAGDSNAVLLNTVGYKSKPPVNAAIIDPSSAAKLSWGAQTSKTIANELEKYLKWQQQQRKSGGRVYYNTGGPVNVSKAEDTAGNYKKEHEKIHGIPVAIEVKEGHDRVKYKPNGDIKFKAKQYADYGAILGTKDADGMNTDVMVGPHKDSEKAYIIDQRKHDTGKFDEHKVMLGFNKRKKAIKAYTKSYADRHGKDRVQDVVKTNISGLKKWLNHGDLKKAAAKDALINRALEVVSKKT